MRRPWIRAGLVVAVALTPALAFAATTSHRSGVALGATWIVFVVMIAVVAAMWRHFARRMLANLRPRWEDWGRG